MQIVALDVHYQGDQARTGWVLFRDWADAQPLREGILTRTGVADYRPGEFYKRELPGLIEALDNLDRFDVVIVDGYCWLGSDRPGMGVRLHQALGERCPVLGVAKTAFHGNPGIAIRRGNSQSPLFVTACGMREAEAARHIENMHGPFRLPTLLKRVDQLARGKG